MKSHWKGLSFIVQRLIFASFTEALESSRGLPGSATVPFSLNALPKNLQLPTSSTWVEQSSQGLLLGERERRKKKVGEKGRKEGREGSVTWLLGFICHQNSHITESHSGIWRTKTFFFSSLSLHFQAKEWKHFFLRRAANLAYVDDAVRVFTGPSKLLAANC